MTSGDGVVPDVVAGPRPHSCLRLHHQLLPQPCHYQGQVGNGQVTLIILSNKIRLHHLQLKLSSRIISRDGGKKAYQSPTKWYIHCHFYFPLCLFVHTSYFRNLMRDSSLRGCRSSEQISRLCGQSVKQVIPKLRKTSHCQQLLPEFSLL